MARNLAALGVAGVGEDVVHVLAPDVEDLVAVALVAALVIGLGLVFVADVDAEGRDEVFVEVLVLVVAPDEDEVGLEGVDLVADLPEALDEALPVGGGGDHGVGAVGAVLLPHLGGPVVLVLPVGGHEVALPVALHLRRHEVVGVEQERIVGRPRQHDFAHGTLISCGVA